MTIPFLNASLTTGIIGLVILLIGSALISGAEVALFSLSKKDLDEAKKLMIEMSDNYKRLLDLFPENSKTGFETEALPSIWENKDEFNLLMTKASSNMIELTSAIDGADDVKATLGKYMWSSCKSCHSKFRAPH
jgi:cytochrome c556